MPRENKLFNPSAVRYLAERFRERTAQLDRLVEDFEKKGGADRYVSMAHHVSLESGLVALDEFMNDLSQKISGGKFVSVYLPGDKSDRGARTTEKSKTPRKGGDAHK